MSETSIEQYDPSIPRRGAFAPAQMHRDQMSAIATSNIGSSEPAIPARIIGDVKFSSLNLTTTRNITITFASTTHEVDVANPSNPSNTSPSDVVSAINAAFDPSLGQAYIYSEDATDNTAYVMLESYATGSGATITLDRGTGTSDALDVVFGTSMRGVTPPYTVNGVDLPTGYKWYQTTNGDDDALQVYLGAPATAVGIKDLTGGVDLTVRRYLRIKIVSDDGTFGPLDIDIGNGSSTSSSYIEGEINAAFQAAVGWPGGANGPASIVARNGSGEYLKIVSGPYDAPSIGETTQIVISESTGDTVDGIGIDYLKDDAIGDVLGYAQGEIVTFGSANLPTGEKISRLPQIFTGFSFSTSGLRGWNERSGPGIGPWGKIMDSPTDLPSEGESDGEVRYARNTGVPWIYREGRAGTSLYRGWRRAIPGYEWPLAYDRENERYRIRRTTETYTSQPFDYDYALDTVATHIRLLGSDSRVIETIDAKDKRWPDTTYSKHEDETSGARNLHRDNARCDDFSRTGVPFPVLASSEEGGAWSQSAGASNRTGSIGFRAYNLSGSGIEDQCYYHHSAGYLFEGPDGDGTTTNFSFTITSPDITATSGIRARSIHVVVVDVDGSTGAYTATSVRGFSDGASPTANIVGTGFTSTNTVALASGVVTLNFSAAPTASQRILVSFAIGQDLIVSALVAKTGENQSGNRAEVGLIYAARPNASGAMDDDTGYLLRIGDDGIGTIHERSGSSTEVQVGNTFHVDPPLDTQDRTLRVIYLPAGSVAYHVVIWNGSNSAEDWFRRDLEPETGLLTSSQTRGGTELGRRLDPIVFLYSQSGVLYNAGNTHCGIITKSVAASGSVPQKNITVKSFQIHGGKSTAVDSVEPGLPPVSGIRLRDSIHSVRLSKDGVIDTSGIITDCNHETPLILNATGDLVDGASIDVAGRTINFGLDMLSILSNTDLIWSPSNPNGILAFWVYGGNEEGLVDLTNERLNGVNSSSTAYSTVGSESTFWQPASGEYLVTTLPPTSASWRHIIRADVTKVEQRDDQATAVSASGHGRNAIGVRVSPPTYFEFNIPWVSNYLHRPIQGSIWGLAIRFN